MKIKTFLLLILTLTALSGYSQNKRELKQQKNAVLKEKAVKPVSKTIKTSTVNPKALNPQPLPPVVGKSKVKGLNPQSEPPGKLTKAKINTLNPQPLPPKGDKPATSTKIVNQKVQNR